MGCEIENILISKPEAELCAFTSVQSKRLSKEKSIPLLYAM